MNTGYLLIAEDEENDVFFLQRAIRKAGIMNPTIVLDNGQEVIDYLKGTGKYQDRIKFPLPYLLLLDLKLPCVSGAEVLTWIRSQPSLSRLPVVVFTSSTLLSDISDAYKAGANSYAVKPSDPDELVRLMQDFANWWLRQNVAPY